MNPIIFLILFPLLVAMAIFAVPKNKLRRASGYLAAVIIILSSCWLIYGGVGAQAATYYSAGDGWVDNAMLICETLMAVFIAYKSIVAKKYFPLVLAILQTLVLIYVELGMGHGREVEATLFVDQLSLIMALIIGVVGSLICVYGFDYMKDFHKHHEEVADRRGMFFMLLFLFLGAMFGLVFSNSLLWIYFFWEVTTLCSFLLIGYTGTKEAVENAFKALTMNLFGSLAFIFAIFYLATLNTPVLTLEEVLLTNKVVLLIPAALIGLAGLTKSAQMPFSSWLVGAMVAPTPVSALLHSSTMVKAGVYLLIRFAPIYEGTLSGSLLSFVGGITFLFASGIAISQSNAKRVLAYSTIANLGLIVACAGVGSYEAVWAAVLLLIFHAVAKSLMFLSVGTVEHRIRSRDIEDMEGLITRLPRTAFLMLIGIAGMFLAPFGMLISKWATLRAFLDSNPILVGIVALGSGITVFFWSKWAGKLIAETRINKTMDERIGFGEWTALSSLAALTIATCLLFPIISRDLVEPYVFDIYGNSSHLSQDNVMIMLMMLATVLLVPLSMIYYSKKRKHLPPYMSGRPTTSDMHFSGSLGVQREMALKNYYLEDMFGERKLVKLGVTLCSLLIAGMLIVSWAGVVVLWT